MNIKELKQDIENQTRNGRDKIYIRIRDLQELELLGSVPSEDKRQFVSVDYLQKLIYNYENNNSITYKNNMKLVKADKEVYRFENI